MRKENQREEDVPASEDATIKEDIKSPPKWMPLARQAIWPLHARFPNLIPNPYGEHKELFREMDSTSNNKTKMEADAKLELACIQISEIFGPSEIDSLYIGLQRLGWDQDKLLAKESNIFWIQNQRLYGTEGTLYLDWIHKTKDEKNFILSRYSANFPKEFSTLIVRIHQLTPSVTCLNIAFILNSENSMEYMRAINKPQKTKIIPRRGSRNYHIKNPEHLKEDATRDIREKYRKLSISWASRYFPGFFHKNCELNQFPTMEILLLEGHTPFDKETPHKTNIYHWTRFANIDSYTDAWISKKSPSLRFSLNTQHDTTFPNHITAALRRDTLTKNDTRHHDAKSTHSLVHFTISQLDGITSKHALICYLKEILRSIKEERQSLSPEIVKNGSNQGAQKINKYFLNAIGTPTIARESEELSRNTASFKRNASGFIDQPFPKGSEPHDISDRLRLSLAQLSRKLLDEDRDTRDFMNQLSSAIGTKESMAAQRRMEIVAIIALIVSVASMLFAAFS